MPLETVKKLAALTSVERRALKRELLALFRRAEILAQNRLQSSKVHIIKRVKRLSGSDLTRGIFTIFLISRFMC